MTIARLALAVPMTVAVGAGLVVGCGSGVPSPPPAVEVGDVSRGEDLLEAYGCGACHTIPGIRGANGVVGPPLTEWSRRSYIAGSLVNNEDNLVTWIVDPDGVEPGTAMPDLGVSPLEAADIAAYLFTLD